MVNSEKIAFREEQIFIKLIVLFHKDYHHCDNAHQQEAEDEQQQGKAQQLGRGTASGEGVFFQIRIRWQKHPSPT